MLGRPVSYGNHQTKQTNKTQNKQVQPRQNIMEDVIHVDV